MSDFVVLEKEPSQWRAVEWHDARDDAESRKKYMEENHPECEYKIHDMSSISSSAAREIIARYIHNDKRNEPAEYLSPEGVCDSCDRAREMANIIVRAIQEIS